MRALFPFVIVGITTGAVYALASMGLVLTYTTSGVFNFAHGAIGMFATFIFYQLRVDAGWPTWSAVAGGGGGGRGPPPPPAGRLGGHLRRRLPRAPRGPAECRRRHLRRGDPTGARHLPDPGFRGLRRADRLRPDDRRRDRRRGRPGPGRLLPPDAPRPRHPGRGRRPGPDRTGRHRCPGGDHVLLGAGQRLRRPVGRAVRA